MCVYVMYVMYVQNVCLSVCMYVCVCVCIHVCNIYGVRLLRVHSNVSTFVFENIESKRNFEVPRFRVGSMLVLVFPLRYFSAKSSTEVITIR